tara:strand:- start:133277 stop:136021 length:2745 start_codon:yes stop_codon:yes gene_type:complete
MKYILFFISFLLTSFLFAQKVFPPIYNYKIFDYKAASQNWGITIDTEGSVYVANNKGLLHFNGEEWILNKLPNGTIIRSVRAVDDKIYTGSYEEFGYWKKSEFGTLVYTSLTHLITNYTFTNEEFWQILSYKEAIIFRSFSSIYIYKNNAIKVLDVPIIVNDIEIYEDNIMVSGSNDRLYQIKNDILVSCSSLATFDKTIISMLAIPQGLLLGTKLEGIFLYKDGEIGKWDNHLNDELKRYQLNDMISLSDGKLAFGTIKKGVYLLDTFHNSFVHLDRETGLQNNTVLAMVHDENQLWLGLDNGIDRVRTNSPITYYTDFSGAIGTVYDLALQDHVQYIGSNTGVYYFENDTLSFVEGTQGHVWDLLTVEEELFAGHNTGTFKIHKKVLEKVSEISGGYQLVKVPESTNTYLQGTYVGISKFEKTDQKAWEVKPIRGISFPVKQLCFESANVLWVAHPYKGFFRLTLNKNLDKIETIQTFDDEAIPNSYNVKVYSIKNQIVFYANGIWYAYNAIANNIEVFDEFKKFTNKELIYNDGTYFWFINNETKEITFTDLRATNLTIAESILQKRLIPDAESVTRLNDSIFALTLNDGFARVNIYKLTNQLNNSFVPKPSLNYFKTQNKLYALNDTLFKLTNKAAEDITFQVSAPNLDKPRYYYTLNNGTKTQSYDVDQGTINFQNLFYGSYEIEIFTVSMDGKYSEPLRFYFQIAPPWYLSLTSKVLYVLIFIAILFAVRGYNRKKLKRRQRSFEEKLGRQQEEHLAKLEKEKLAKEIKLKQKELTSTTLNIAKKNEIILELKSMMVMNKDKFTSASRYGTVIKKLDKSVNDKEDWKRFEMNFKELHEDFFERLLLEFPKLTPKDLKLCAYLKMNLSSKEIAPLMGISLRGVEIHRYRLRKKLNMETSDYLSNYLITF